MALTLRRSGAPSLSYDLHAPDAKPIGAVLLTHGYAEHRGRYGQVISALTARGLMVASYDLRGHGHSEGERGHILSFRDYVDDAYALGAELAKDDRWKSAGLPVLLGHSLGGLISFHVALSDPSGARGVVLSSPFFGLALEVPAPKRLAGRLMSRVLPAFGLPSGLRGADVTHDPVLARAYDEDPMLVKKATARWFTEAMAAQQRALEDAPSMRLPLTIFHGGADKIASVEATRRVFDRCGAATKRLEVLDGQYHEIFNELERDRWIGMAADAIVEMAERR